MKPESRLEIAERQVRDAEEDVARQKRIVEDLVKAGHPAVGARTLLRLLQQTLDNYREALYLIRSSRS